MNHASLFSGIGGPEVAAAMLGWNNVFHFEINDFGRKILEYWFPESESYEDIKKTDFTKWRGNVDVLTGGFPCQPFSYAGKRGGANDDRYLWPEFKRVISEVRPAWVVGENVAGITTMVEPGEVSQMDNQAALFDESDTVHRYQYKQPFTIERVCKDLEDLGYTVQPVVVPACAVGAPHRRDRVFIIANANERANGRRAGEDAGTGCAERLQERHEVRKPYESNQIRPEGATIPQDSMHGRQLHGCDGEQGSERHIGNAGARDNERICREASRIDTADADSARQSTPNRKSGREWEEMDGRSESIAFDGSCRFGRHGFIADTIGDGSGTQSEDTSIKGEGGFIPQHGERREPTQRADGLSPLQRHITDTECGRRRPLYQHMESKLADGSESFGNGCEWNASDTTQQPGERLRPQQPEYCREEQKQFRGRGGEDCGVAGCGRWQNFPTVAHVHRGNDGLPFDVDCLTIPFNKWRTESLKAYGNAIVPQVMYEIFRAIELTTRQK